MHRTKQGWLVGFLILLSLLRGCALFDDAPATPPATAMTVESDPQRTLNAATADSETPVAPVPGEFRPGPR